MLTSVGKKVTILDETAYSRFLAKADWPLADTTIRSAGMNYPSVVAKKYEKWADNLTEAQINSIREYTGSYSTEINHALRDPNYVWTEHWLAHGKNITEALAKVPSAPPPPLLVWRGVDPRSSSFDILSRLKVGDVHTMTGGFQSTSISPAQAMKFSTDKYMPGYSPGGVSGVLPGNRILLEIKPKRGAYINMKAIKVNSPNEQEFLINSGERYIVRGIKRVQFRAGSIRPDALIERTVIQLEMK
jgi:hypothetical protein